MLTRRTILAAPVVKVVTPEELILRLRVEHDAAATQEVLRRW